MYIVSLNMNLDLNLSVQANKMADPDALLVHLTKTYHTLLRYTREIQ